MEENAVAMTFSPFKVIVNLCFSNLLSAVVVKSISIVHNAYAGDRIRLSLSNLQFFLFSRLQCAGVQHRVLYPLHVGLAADLGCPTLVHRGHVLALHSPQIQEIAGRAHKMKTFTRCKGWNLGESNKQIFCDNYEIPCIF